MNNASHEIERMLVFAERQGLICAEDIAYARNRLLEIMRMDAPEDVEGPLEAPATLTPMLDSLCAIAAKRGIIRDTLESRDLFSARLAGAVTPSPYETRARFRKLLEESPQSASSWFYKLCRDCDYIKTDRIAKNVRFHERGLEITINLSKPEKDPRDIASAARQKQAAYPKCMLCVENPGYAGRPGFPARQNHRAIPLTLCAEAWHMQFSPYLYYDEHLIVFSDVHRPMRVTQSALTRMFEFVAMFPHYFLGSNADLPIVGGSILSHDHFQGGNHVFPMDLAKDEITLASCEKRVTASIVDWPMSCLRLKSKNEDDLIRVCMRVLDAWRDYTDDELGIYAHTSQPHNAITPILRKDGDTWIMHLVLRNNYTSAEHPLGVFHPHADLHHIKKENIGLIEVMGLMILPGRLMTELDAVESCLTGKTGVEALNDSCHYDWVKLLASRHGVNNDSERARAILRGGLAEKCLRVLADAGVYKQTPEGRRGFLRFLNSIGFAEAI